MSANNFVSVQEVNGGWQVAVRDADTAEVLYLKALKPYKNLRTAIKKGQEEDTEYGLQFYFKK
jgi:hypothetical protein